MGGVKCGESDPTEEMNDEQFVQELRSGKIYIGKVISQEITVNIRNSSRKFPVKQQTQIRQLIVRKILLKLLLWVLDKDLLKLDHQHIVIRFADWWDAAPAFNKGILSWMLGLVYDESIFKPTASFQQV